MRFHFYSPRALEPWDWRTPDTQGIGNSETSHIEMACRLAARGHDVISYTKLPDGARSGAVHRGVAWRDLGDADFSNAGVWALYRCPDAIDHFTETREDRQAWLVVQDTYFVLSDVQAGAVDKVLVLCQGQRAEQAKQSPNIADKLVVTSNGIRVDMIAEVEAVGVPPRTPTRIHFSSSPDRGLKPLLQYIFPRAKEIVPDLELHVYYGWNNIDILMGQGSDEDRERAKRFFGPNMEETKKLLNQPGVVWHGRVGQRELTHEWLKAGLWVFPSMYPESSCATSMEAQALGAIPIAHPLWGVGENVQWGTLIDGNTYTDKLTQARYVAEIVRLATQPALQDAIRRPMMAEARQRCSWDRFVEQWAAWVPQVEAVAC
jgi:glycosyltransferase involved in cell wall biosynthesis